MVLPTEGDEFTLSEMLGEVFGRRRDDHMDLCRSLADALNDRLFNRNDYIDKIRSMLDVYGDALAAASSSVNATGDLDAQVTGEIVAGATQWLSLNDVHEPEGLRLMVVLQKASIALMVVVFALNAINHGVQHGDPEAMAWVAGRPDYEVQGCACNAHDDDGAAAE